MSKGRSVVDIKGNTYGKLKVIERAENIGMFSAWKCICDCGKETTVRGYALKNGNTTTCGRCNKVHDEIFYVFKENYVEGHTTSGEIFLIDKEDYPIVKDLQIFMSSGYATFSEQGKLIKLHRYLMNPVDSQKVDHINRNRADNRRENLRVCSQAENTRNRGIDTRNKSGYTGVYQDKQGKWVASINHEGKRIYLGAYENKEDAARIRRKAEWEFYGEFTPLIARDLSLEEESKDQNKSQQNYFANLDVLYEENNIFKIPVDVICNIGFTLKADEFMLYVMLNKLYENSKGKEEMVIDSKSLKQLFGISDNRTLINRLNNLHKEKLLKNKTEEIPRNGKVPVVFNSDVYNNMSQYISVTAWLFKSFSEKTLSVHAIRILLFNLTTMLPGDDTLKFVFYATMIERLKVSATNISKAKKELIANGFITESVDENGLDRLLHKDVFFVKDGLFV